MLIYSQKIIQFVNEIRRAAKEILSKEVGLRVFGDRFYDRRQDYSFPIKVVIFDNRRLLGYFDPDFYEMGFHESLMHGNRRQLHQVIRHELAHYITFINNGPAVLPHGAEFRAFCQQMGWGEEVYGATLCLETALNATIQQEESTILRKVQKLMALATSSNKNEAEQAMIKSQQLLLKHNIDANAIDGEDEEKVILKRIMKQKVMNTKMRSIALILQTFFVSAVFSRGGEFTYLEILGNAVNVEVADYVAAVLDTELDRLWSQAQKQSNLKGKVAKNSFFLGLARGYCNKVKALKQGHSSEMSHALIVIEKKLCFAKELIYPRLSTSKSQGNYCATSSALGEKMGRELTINPALKSNNSAVAGLVGLLD